MLNKSYVLIFDIFTLNIFVVLCAVSKPYAFVLVLKMVLVKIKGQGLCTVLSPILQWEFAVSVFSLKCYNISCFVLYY